MGGSRGGMRSELRGDTLLLLLTIGVIIIMTRTVMVVVVMVNKVTVIN